MRGLAILLILAGVGYLVYTQGMPRLEERRQAEAVEASEAERSLSCVGRARAVNSAFARDIRQFGQPPIDGSLWASFMLQVSGELTSADSACSCSAEACASASAALLELRGLVNDLNSFIRSAGPPVTDAASRLETVERLLDRAQRQAG